MLKKIIKLFWRAHIYFLTKSFKKSLCTSLVFRRSEEGQHIPQHFENFCTKCLFETATGSSRIDCTQSNK